MQETAAQIWLERKLARRDDVVSALVVLSAPEGLRTAAIWPPGRPDEALARAAQAAFDAGVKIDEPLEPRAGEACGTRLVSGPLHAGGNLVGALAMTLDRAARSARDTQPGPQAAATVTAPLAPPAPSRATAPQVAHAPAPAKATAQPVPPVTPRANAQPARHAAPREPAQAAPSAAARVNARSLPPFVSEPPGGAAPEASRASGSPRTGSADRAKPLLDCIAAALEQDSAERATLAVANEIERLLDCDRVSIGYIARRTVRVAATSHSASAGSGLRPLKEVGAAMDEAIDQRVAIRFPPLPGDRPRIVLAHAELAQSQGSGAICTVALVRGTEPLGALTCERRGAQPFDDASVALLEDIAAAIGPLLQMARERDHTALSRLGANLAAVTRRVLRPGHWRVKALAVALLLGAAALPFVPVNHRVTAPARLEGAIQRTLVAPADGFLRQTHVRPGDTVRQGQVLAELAEEDLNFEKRRWESEVARYEGVHAEALARQDRAQLVIAQARAAEARAQLDVVEQQLLRSRLIAPFDGVVIKGDLKQQLGAPVKRGDTLLVLAPAAEFRVIVEVDERDIGAIRVGQQGAVALAASPNHDYALAVARIKPVAATRDGRNFFEVEATLPEADETLRPGLEGVAKIDIEHRPLYWVLGHRAIDWMRLAFWSWIR